MQENNEKASTSNDFNELPIAIKSKLSELVGKIDIIESMVNQFESKSLKDVNSQVNKNDLKFIETIFIVYFFIANRIRFSKI
jgi:hypothetical protein